MLRVRHHAGYYVGRARRRLRASLALPKQPVMEVAVALRPIPEQSILLQLLRYDRRTGKLYWRKRDPSFFPAGPRRNNACSSWNSRYAGKEALTAPAGPRGYRGGTLLGKSCLAHRVIWKMIHGTDPGPEIDHRDGDHLNNRVENLASGDKAANQKNAFQRSDNTSGRTGVYFRPHGVWTAAIFEDKKLHWLGTYRTFENAVAVREAAERRLGYSARHGERKRT